MRRLINRTFLVRVGILCVVVYLSTCAMLYAMPQLFLYHPSEQFSDLMKAKQNGYPATFLEYKSFDGIDLYGWYTEGKKENGKVVIFTHGNSCNLDCFYSKLIPFVEKGYSTFLPEYRGFGGIRGKITDKNLVEDVKSGFRELKKKGYKNEDIIVYGMSLGSHMATSLAYYMNEEEGGPANALVLEVPFDSVPNTATTLTPIYMPFDILIRHKFDNVPLIQNVNTRVLIQAAGLDVIVPNNQASNLYKIAIEPKKYMLYKEGTHVNLYDYGNYNDIISWLENKK